MISKFVDVFKVVISITASSRATTNRFLPVLGQTHHLLLELQAGQAIPEPARTRFRNWFGYQPDVARCLIGKIPTPDLPSADAGSIYIRSRLQAGPEPTARTISRGSP